MQNNRKNPEIFHAQAEIGQPRNAGSGRWPLAGQKLTSGLREALGLKEGETPSRILIAGTSQQYRLVDNDYLIPYYPTVRAYHSDDQAEVAVGESITRRNEALIVSRARSFINNAQPELGVPRSLRDINDAQGEFSALPDATYNQRAEKAGQFKILTGAIVTRLETLGRIITQGNGHGAQIEYPDIRDADTIPPERLDDLRKAFGKLYQFITDPALVPLLRTVLFTDRSIDRDGVLIDLIREIGKPLHVSESSDEEYVRGGIIHKIGNAMESIDQVRDTLINAITQKPINKLFAGAIQHFIETSGEQYEVHSVEDVVQKLDYYASLCKARTCVRGDDRKAYDEIFRKKSALNGLFTSENGLLESMRRVGRGSSVEVQELRSIMKRGIRLMERVGYTRIPCNENAPEIWIPPMDHPEDLQPMEQYLVERLVLDHDRPRVKKILKAGEGLPEEAREPFLKKKFCTLGFLTEDLSELKAKIERHEQAHAPILRGK